MRTAIVISLLAVMSVCAASAQQDTPKTPAPATPTQNPPATASPQAERKTETSSKPADPMTMAAPNPSTKGKNAPQSAVDTSSFILGAEDQVAVFVFQGPEFTGSHMIRPDGKLTIPLIGDVQAAGLTPEALAKSVKEKIKAFMNDPEVTVSVLGVKSTKYFIQGEVRRTGEFPLVVPTKVLEALVNAGGFNDFAKLKDITIMHTDGTRDKFNYNEVIKGKKLEQNKYLKDRDIIIVR